MPLTGAVIVTTPQDIALLDAKKGIKMFEKVGVPILGIVENMAVHVCSNCGHVEHIFGAEGGKSMAAEYGMDYLGALPLDLSIREQADSGQPDGGGRPRRRDRRRSTRRVARQVAVEIAQQGQGLLGQVPDHHDLEEHLRPWHAERPVDPRWPCVMERESAAQPLGGLALLDRRGACPTRRRSAREPRVLRDDGTRRAALHPGFTVELFADEGEGYYLNLTLGRAGVVRDVAHRRRRPVARLARGGDAVVQRGRPLARRAGARRQRAAAGRAVRAWLQAFTDEHYRPEPKQRRAAGVVPAAGGAAMSGDATTTASCRAGRGARRRRAKAAAPAAEPPPPSCRCAERGGDAGARLPRRGPQPRRRRAGRAAAEPPPPPTLDDVAALTRDSDYTRFVAPDVDPAVKNAALKKLFTDPHFNVMDGWTPTSTTTASPTRSRASMLRQMAQSQCLGLFDDEDERRPTRSADQLPCPPRRRRSPMPLRQPSRRASCR